MQKNIYHLEKDKSELEKILDEKNQDEEFKKMAEIELNDLKDQVINEKIEIIFCFQKMSVIKTR